MLNLQFLEQKMTEKGLTYREMSQLMGFTSSGTIWKWVHGQNQIRAQHIERLAEILEAPVQDFFILNADLQSPCQGGDFE